MNMPAPISSSPPATRINRSVFPMLHFILPNSLPVRSMVPRAGFVAKPATPGGCTAGWKSLKASC
jgi:hypothetical protein